MGSQPISTTTSIINCAATHQRSFLTVLEKSDSASVIPAYIPSAKGGVIPHITPQIHGNIAAANNGLTPTAAIVVIIAGPNTTTSEDPGIAIPKKQVNKQANTTMVNFEKFSESTNSCNSVVTLRSANKPPIIYPKIHVTIVGTILFKPLVKAFAIAGMVTVFLSSAISTAKSEAIPAVNKSTELDKYFAPVAPSLWVKKVLLKQ